LKRLVKKIARLVMTGPNRHRSRGGNRSRRGNRAARLLAHHFTVFTCDGDLDVQARGRAIARLGLPVGIARGFQ